MRQKGLAERHYKTMEMTDVAGLPVQDLAAKDSVLLLWAVDCMIPQALEIGQLWGFKFKTVAFTWVKRTQTLTFHIGLGYWTRGNPEQCLLFTRGKPKRQSASVRQLIDARRREHSRKPDEQYGRIETLLPGPYLELFARTERAGWDSWGNQSGHFAEATE